MSNLQELSELQDVVWLSPQEAADLLGISRTTIKKLVKEGYIKAYRIKGVRGLRFKHEDVLALIEVVNPDEVGDGE